MSEFLVTAAGGNGTAIQVRDTSLTRSDYETSGRALSLKYEDKGAEQAGFLILDDLHFEMAGGEFCGNATRAAALLLSLQADLQKLEFTTSGFDDIVYGTVNPRSKSRYFVSCTFNGMQTTMTKIVLSDGRDAIIVDLGGIVHVLLEEAFPSGSEHYTVIHRSINRECNLGSYDAVGVIWYEQTGADVIMHPVVWVRAIDTFYYETSCGSGAIAVSAVTGLQSIVQPTGKPISVRITTDAIVLEGEMEIVD